MTNSSPIPLGSFVTFRAVNAYMERTSSTWRGEVIRRNKRSVTVRTGGGVCTVPYENILEVAA